MEKYNQLKDGMIQAKNEVKRDLTEPVDWKVVKEKDGICIKRRDEKHSHVPTFKGETVLNVSPKVFFEEILLNKNNRRNLWNPSHVSSKTLDVYETETSHFELYTDAISGALGGLISGRDMVNARDWEETDGSYFFWFTR